METSRFFVANLPPHTKEQDLSRLFQDYGEVLRVELKTKENLVDAENAQVKLAFVTLKIGADDVSYCVNELNWQKVNGAQIKVSLAKESFLDRLKREREEAAAAATGGGTPKTGNGYHDAANSSELLTPRNLSNTRKKFAEDVDLDDEDIAPELLITKRRAGSSLHNGKIVIQSYNATPIHVIEAKKPAKHQLDAKSTTADQKRKESLNKMKNQYQQNKFAIQRALAGSDASASKKIKFSDAEDDEEPSKTKANLFDSDDADDNDDVDAELNLKATHFGKKGAKLIEMQSRQSLDPRFKIGANFVNEDDEEDDNGNEEDDVAHQIEEGGVDSERNWQMGILEQVVGNKIDTGNAAQKAAKNKKMLRFDPAKDEHQKFIRTKQKAPPPADAADTSKSKGKQKKKAANLVTEAAADETSDNVGPEVSKELFYVVTDTLTESLKRRGDGFSLLNMFGKSEEAVQEQREDQLKKFKNEKILVNKYDKYNAALNPFSYDDSSSGSDDETTPANVGTRTNHVNEKQKKQKAKIAVESFFIPKNDARLKEGATFFKYTKQPDENYDEVRNRLKLLIRTKITKSQKKLAGLGGKGRNNKKFKK